MTEIDPLKFASHVEFLKVVSEQALSRKNRPFTLENWAKRLGYRSHRSMGMVLSGQRLPSPKMNKKLAKDLELNQTQQKYLTLLVILEKTRRKGKSIQPILLDLEKLNPVFSQEASLDATTFAYIAEWYHLVIKQLIATPGFKNDIEWIRAKLDYKVSAAEVKNAIRVMERLEFIEKKNKTLIVKPASKNLKTSAETNSKAVALHHKQMIKHASDSIDSQASADREITSVTLKFDRRRIQEAKAAIRKFREEFQQTFAAEHADDVYQFNMQLFSHTKIDKGDKHHE